MSVRKLKPITPGSVLELVTDFDAITTWKAGKSFACSVKKSREVENSQEKDHTQKGEVIKKYRVIGFQKV